MRTLVLDLERPAPAFLPGQFLHLALDEYDPSRHWPDSRAFSIASSPEERSRLEITVSAVGRFTRRMLGLAVGDHVAIKLPYGDFVVDWGDQGHAVLVAGGTGITPFASLLASRSPLQGAVRLLYGARRPELMVYRAVVEAAAQRWPNFQWTGFAEEGASGDLLPGRLSAASALKAAGEMGRTDATVFYVSGPPDMLTGLRGDLSKAGVPPGHVRIDAWS